MSSDAVKLWDEFVAAARRDSAALDDGVGELRAETMHRGAERARAEELAYLAFSIASSSLLLGDEHIGKLASACERCLVLSMTQAIAPELGLWLLAPATHTLRRAIESLARADRSGARADPKPLEAARFELEAALPAPGAAARSSVAPDVPLSALRRGPAERAPAHPGASQPASPPESQSVSPPAQGKSPAAWVPSVGDDMVELFFDEVDERIEGLSLTLIDLEQNPEDSELIRSVFRDLHTLKGSSAMVGLMPMNALAHTAEDLVGQLRDGERTVDGAIIDALLAALDGLRDIAALAKHRQPLDIDISPILEHLRNPYAGPVQPDVDHRPAASPADDPAPSDAEDPAPSTPAAGRSPGVREAAAAPARQTIRVDFDKLDRLMNLVGELVLGRDGLRTALHSLSSVADELSSERLLTRRLLDARRSLSASASQKNKALGGLRELGDEIGRVERVLLDIAQELDQASGRLDSVSDDLREQVMKLRMVPIGGIFRKHHRTVRDLAVSLGKRARLVLFGEDTELDKLLVEALDEPLMHAVRNAVDHGIETPDERVAAGKPPEGEIRLSASHHGNLVVVEIADDGRGIDPRALRQRALERGLYTETQLAELDDREVLDVIFRPGFSTAATVSQVSGRGVGMDVVRQTIITQLKGTIDITSVHGQGTTFTLRLPLTLAIIQVLIASAGGEVFAIPLDVVERTLSCAQDRVRLVQDREVITVRGRQLPLIRLSQVLELERAPYAGDALMQVVITEFGGERYGLVCDHLIGKKEIVIKPLGDILENVPCAAGATLLGERCALILDVPAIIRRAIQQGARAEAVVRPETSRQRLDGNPSDSNRPHILLVDDSDTVRESLRRLIVDAGYACTTAQDGVEGLALAMHQRFDLVSTDVMMPRMDGYEFTRRLRAMPEYKDTPIVMVTSRGERIDRVRGFDAGVDEYITKPHDRQLLLRTIRALLGESPASARDADDSSGPADPSRRQP